MKPACTTYSPGPKSLDVWLTTTGSQPPASPPSSPPVFPFPELVIDGWTTTVRVAIGCGFGGPACATAAARPAANAATTAMPRRDRPLDRSLKLSGTGSLLPAAVELPLLSKRHRPAVGVSPVEPLGIGPYVGADARDPWDPAGPARVAPM